MVRVIGSGYRKGDVAVRPGSLVKVPWSSGLTNKLFASRCVKNLYAGALSADWNKDSYDDLFLWRRGQPNELYLGGPDGLTAHVEGIDTPGHLVGPPDHNGLSKAACTADFDEDG